MVIKQLFLMMRCYCSSQVSVAVYMERRATDSPTCWESPFLYSSARTKMPRLDSCVGAEKCVRKLALDVSHIVQKYWGTIIHIDSPSYSALLAISVFKSQPLYKCQVIIIGVKNLNIQKVNQWKMNVNFDILNELIETCEELRWSVCYITLLFFKTILFIKKIVIFCGVIISVCWYKG